MLRGLYTATAGMAAQMAAIDLLSNNVANSNTLGFKEDFESLVRGAANPLSYGMGGLVRGTGIMSVNQSLDLTQGSLSQTGRTFDLALQGPGMFGVRTASGVSYTRNGRFHLNPQLQVVTDTGNLVLDSTGRPLQLPDPQGRQVAVREDGTIAMDGTVVGQFGVFDATGWQKAGNGLYAPVGTARTISTSTVRQGMVENANADLVQTMGALMTTERAYEAAAQLQHSEDQILQQSANDLGRITP